MLILIIKGGLFAFLLVLAAVWDIRKCEIPNTISLLIMITGLLAIDPWDAFSGLVMTGLPYFLAAILIHRDNGFSIGGGDIKLMASCGFVLGAPLGAMQSVISLVLAMIAGLCIRLSSESKKLNSITLPLAPFFCVGGIFSYMALLLSAIY
jgi:leader peptidase (prepilin peptidase)/N-methyltransferase